MAPTGLTGRLGTNALASAIFVIARPRSIDATKIRRGEFLSELRGQLPAAYKRLVALNIAPVDLAQAAIGPGIEIYSKYTGIVEADGSSISVGAALRLINQVLDEALVQTDSDLDPETRWALAWFEQFAFNDGEYGIAETLSKAKVTNVEALADHGMVLSKGGKVRLLRPGEIAANWDPLREPRPAVWKMVHHLIRMLETGGERGAATIVLKLGAQAEIARELAYRLYIICERKKRAAEALAYNGLVQSWTEIMRLAREIQAAPATAQTEMPV